MAQRLAKTRIHTESNINTEESVEEGNADTAVKTTKETEISVPEPLTESSSSAGEYGIAWFEVSSEHFENRTGNIYAISANGAGKKLVYSDIDDIYELSDIYGASPDGTKILGMLAGRGNKKFSAICVIDVLTGQLKKLAEFDFAESKSGGPSVGLYGKPVWSGDSTKIAYELTSYPYLSPSASNFRDVGLFMLDVRTGEKQEVKIDVGGVSARSTTFLAPVFFAENNNRIFMVSHPYYEKRKNGQTTGFYTLNDTLYSVAADGGVPVEIAGTGSGNFSDEGPEVITSFDNFRLLESARQIVFQVLGDFEEDGDLWVCNYDGTGLKKITGNPQIREQQPAAYDNQGSKPKIAYTGSLRYGTITDQIPSGDIFMVNADGSDNKKLTDFKTGPSLPLFSPDGKIVAFLFSEYDKNMDFVPANHIMLYDTENGTLEKISSLGYIAGIAGWVRIR